MADLRIGSPPPGGLAPPPTGNPVSTPASNPCLDVFSFFQANFILVPFSAHRQKVSSRCWWILNLHLSVRVAWLPTPESTNIPFMLICGVHVNVSRKVLCEDVNVKTIEIK